MITDQIGRHNVLLPSICDICLFLKSKHKKFQDFFFASNEKKKRHLSARMMVHTVLLNCTF